MSAIRPRFTIAFLVLLAGVLIASPQLGAAGNGNLAPNTFNFSGALICPLDAEQALGTPMELWMGVGNEAAGMLVGYVTFYTDAGGVGHVKIDLADLDGIPGPDMFPFVPSRVHMHFAPTVAEIPHTKQGNPIPGQFEYNFPVSPTQTAWDFSPVQFDKVGAIHVAVIRYGGIQGFNFYLPNNKVTLQIIDYPSAGDPTYFKMKITNGGFISDYNMGVYEAWCVDTDHTIALGSSYDAFLFSSYDDFTKPENNWLIGPGLIEYPNNLDKVNYIVNAFEAGKQVQPMKADCTPLINPATGQPYPLEALTYSDIQRAIWSFIEDAQSTSGLSNWSQNRVNAILCAANANGEGFVPTCTEKVVFLVVPTGTPGSFSFQVVIGQPVIGWVGVPCTSVEGTAWGDGRYGAQFPGANQWGTYFKVKALPCTP